mmetsp:Transcript_98503/g.234507  ORF Transcript_98503/g.234507 Transcript_98503/m.234507 type:complete len:233 (+) Transcript_98503:3926-4624(+)
MLDQMAFHIRLFELLQHAEFRGHNCHPGHCLDTQQVQLPHTLPGAELPDLMSSKKDVSQALLEKHEHFEHILGGHGNRSRRHHSLPNAACKSSKETLRPLQVLQHRDGGDVGGCRRKLLKCPSGEYLSFLRKIPHEIPKCCPVQHCYVATFVTMRHHRARTANAKHGDHIDGVWSLHHLVGLLHVCLSSLNDSCCPKLPLLVFDSENVLLSLHHLAQGRSRSELIRNLGVAH